MPKLLAALALLFPLFISGGHAFALDVPGKLTAALNEVVDKHHLRSYFHGNVRVLKDGQILFQRSLGLANVEHGVPNTLDKKFLIASLSKQFTAAGILKLRAMGRLALTDKLSGFIPVPEGKTAPPYWHEITIHHLLTHTAGLIKDHESGSGLSRAAYNSLDEIIRASWSNQLLQPFRPGEKFYYSNFGYLLLAKVIELAGKEDYGRFLGFEVLRPLGMKASREYMEAEVVADLADGYYLNSSYRMVRRCCDDASNFRGSHNLLSDLDDLSLWAGYLLGKASEPDPQIQQELMQGRVATGAHTDYGYGMKVTATEYGPLYWHDGQEVGYVSQLSVLQSSGVAVIILGNRHGPLHQAETFFTGKMTQEILSALRESGVL